MTLATYAVTEIAKNQVFGLVLLEVTLEVEFAEALLKQVEHHGLILLKVVQGDQSIPVDSFGFVDPEVDYLFGSLELRGLSQQQALEDPGYVAQVELVVEVEGGLSESG